MRNYCPHPSTWVMVLFTTILMVVLIVPCSKPQPGSRRWNNQYAEHGFPLVYLHRTVCPRIVTQNTLPTAWGLTDSASLREFRLGYLIIDIALALVVIALAGGLWEWWRRKRGQPVQYSLRSVFIVIALAAVGCSYLRVRYVRHVAEERGAAGLQGRALTLWDFTAPDWAWRFADRIEMFWNVNRVHFYGDELTAKDVEAIESFHYLHRLVLLDNVSIDNVDGLIECLGDLSHLEAVSLAKGSIADEDLHKLKEALPHIEVKTGD